MAFTLRVHFTGLCLYVVHTDASDGRVAVLMPDARRPVKGNPTSGSTHTTHRDDEPAVPHAGYLRADLANVQLARQFEATIPQRTLDPCKPEDNGPAFEVVYRLNKQVLDFGLPGSAAVKLGPKMDQVPDATKFAPQLKLLPDLFTGAPEPELLFRTILSGGELIPCPGPETWSIDGRLNGTNQAPLLVNMPGAVEWMRPVTDAELEAMYPGDRDRNVLKVTLTDFKGNTQVVLPLRPVDTANGPMIELKLANLCAQNPLEWNELELREVILEDVDFKWLYQLLDPPGGSWDALLNHTVLPAPRLVSRPKRQSTGDPGDCGPMRIAGHF